MLLAALDVTGSQGIPLQPLPHVPRTMAVKGMVRERTEAKSRSSPRPIKSLLKPIHSGHDTTEHSLMLETR